MSCRYGVCVCGGGGGVGACMPPCVVGGRGGRRVGGVGACMPPCVRVYIAIVKNFPCI